MHELPVTESLLELALSHAERVGARRITDLHIVIGDLSSIVDDSVSFYWDFVSRDTPAEGARLHFQRVPLTLACKDCGKTYELEGDDLRCPECRSVDVRVVRGEEFYLESIEVEQTAPETVSLGSGPR